MFRLAKAMVSFYFIKSDHYQVAAAPLEAYHSGKIGCRDPKLNSESGSDYEEIFADVVFGEPWHSWFPGEAIQCATN